MKTIMTMSNENSGSNINVDVEKMMMKKSNGEPMKLPIGFRFRPTDQELLVHYLKRKALSLPLPASVIPDIHHLLLFHSHPSSLPGNLREKRYYFCKRRGSKCCRIIMVPGSGFWKAVGKGKQVISPSGQNDVVGKRKSWAFYQVDHGKCSKTRWFMHEFQLLETQNRTGEVEDEWVVCSIFQRKMRPKNQIQGISERNGSMRKNNECNLGIIERPSYIDFRVESTNDLVPPQPSSPSMTDSC